MYVQVKNENYGYSVSTFGDFIAVGNPGIERYSEDTASVTWSGSVDIFLYDKSTDQHEHVGSLYKDKILYEILLAAETGSPIPPQPVTGSLKNGELTTELGGTNISSADLNLQLNTGIFTRMLNDGYGLSLDVYDNVLAVGCPYYLQRTEIATNVLDVTGSSVDIFDLNRYRENSVNSVLISDVNASVNLGTGSEAGNIHIFTTNSPANYDYVDILYSRRVGGPYETEIARSTPPILGGFVEFYIDPLLLPLFGFFKLRFTKNPNPFLYNITDPDADVVGTGSFGYAVSINDGWLAVGSPYVGGTTGRVYIYKNESTTNQYSWSFQQQINAPGHGLLFGASLELNKVTGSRSGSLIIGIGSKTESKAFLYEYSNGTWAKTYTFVPETTSSLLTFGDYNSYNPTFTTASEYGTAVTMYNNTVVIGSPRNRTVQEYSSSAIYNQGAVYVYELCEGTSPLNYRLALKTFGDETIIKNNRLGQSVGIYGNNIVAGIPKTNINTLSSCEVQSTLYQLHFCNSSLEDKLNGQCLFLQRDTSSLDWGITKIYRKKKKFMEPYKSYGFSVDIADFSMVVGAPMLISNINRQIDVDETEINSIILSTLGGKSYIYNLSNFKPQFHVGNVFYRNGKILLMTAGSVFDGLMFNPISQRSYEYDLDFRSKHTIYEKQIVCTIDPGEFNVSTNPTAITLETSSFDVNGNGYVDFQDIDVLLSYMQYKNTQLYGSGVITTNWSSSIVTRDDEKSLLNYYQSSYDSTHTGLLISESIMRYEFDDTSMQSSLDFNNDSRVDTNDMNILWKHFTNRLTQENYSSFITPACNRRLFSDIVNHMEFLVKKQSVPTIRSEFLNYETLASNDKTGSFLAPFATTIGLYSGLDLVAVAKLGSPIKITPELPLNFIVKMDF
jgi:hypothetical protein